jgi:hypothetical protein
VKLKAFIQNECCNFVSRACIGVAVRGRRFNKTGDCFILLDEPKACEFFRDCVLPTAHHRGYHNELAGDYSFIDKKVKMANIRYCGCGVKLEKSVRLCKKCTKLSKKKGKKK